MHTLLPSPLTAEEVPRLPPNVKLAGGGAESIPGDEESSASDVRSMNESSMCVADALGAAGADFIHQGTELDILETGHHLGERVDLSTDLHSPELACSLRDAWHGRGGFSPFAG